MDRGRRLAHCLPIERKRKTAHLSAEGWTALTSVLVNYNLFDCLPLGDIHDLGNPIAGPNIRRAIDADKRIIYEETRPPGNDGLAGVLIDGCPDLLPRRLDLYDHSLAGFESGYGGSDSVLRRHWFKASGESVLIRVRANPIIKEQRFNTPTAILLSDEFW